jgi:hypothetical protein
MYAFANLMAPQFCHERLQKILSAVLGMIRQYNIVIPATFSILLHPSPSFSILSTSIVNNQQQ